MTHTDKIVDLAEVLGWEPTVESVITRLNIYSKQIQGITVIVDWQNEDGEYLSTNVGGSVMRMADRCFHSTILGMDIAREIEGNGE